MQTLGNQENAFQFCKRDASEGQQTDLWAVLGVLSEIKWGWETKAGNIMSLTEDVCLMSLVCWQVQSETGAFVCTDSPSL